MKIQNDKEKVKKMAKKTKSDAAKTDETPKTEEVVSEQPGEEQTAQADAAAQEAAKAQAEIKTLQEELAATKEQLMRIAAEYDNFRRRTQKEKEALYTDSRSDVLTKLLPVIDNFERAGSAKCDFDGYKKGIEMTLTQLLETMQALGCESFGAVGDEFDPNIHNGVMHIEDENLGENVIAQVFIKGYKIGDRVIRPASVQVAN
ncbi:MAG: nucleotide exchange factor GrpE [Clostridia bacterium]|nr:nucleotide exchange factor GrpE [Clostridia bacterium]